MLMNQVESPFDSGIESNLEEASKRIELEGHSRRNNIRIYGIKEGAERTSMTHFVENPIQTELGEGTGPNKLDIEHAHRALAPLRSTFIKFLKYSTKERIISAAWKKPIMVDGNRVFFYCDYATAVMEKRREYRYLLIKKVLKEKGIKFRTPMTTMRVFLHSGIVMYDNADQAGDGIRAKVFPIPPRPEGEGNVTAPLQLGTGEKTPVQRRQGISAKDPGQAPRVPSGDRHRS